MIKKVILSSLIISIGILSWVQQLPLAQKIKAMVDRVKSEPLRPPEKYQKSFVLAAAMKGPVEERTPDYVVKPMHQPGKSPPPAVATSSSRDNEKKKNKDGEEKVTPKPLSPSGIPH